MKFLDPIWDTLRTIRVCEFVSRSGSLRATGWSGSGTGVVQIETPSPDVLIFRESGVWSPAEGRQLRFNNVYRWTRLHDAVRLEHLRFGEEYPVYLFDLAPTADGRFVSLSPHLCGQDTYAARLRQESNCLFFAWTVVGPEKQEEIEYVYSPFEDVEQTRTL